VLFFSLNTWVLALILCGIIFGATLLGLWIGRRLRKRGDTLREPLGVLQGSILGVVGLVLAFGLALAVGRYEARRAVVVDDANAIGTAYLRAQTLPEPIRTSSLQLLTSYTDAEIALSDHVPAATTRWPPSRSVPTFSSSCGRWRARPCRQTPTAMPVGCTWSRSTR